MNFLFAINFRERIFEIARWLVLFAQSLASTVSVLMFFFVGLGVFLLGFFSASFSFCLHSFFWGPARVSFLCASPSQTQVSGRHHLPQGTLHVHSLSFSVSPPLAWVGSCSCSFCFSPLALFFSLSFLLSLSLASNSTFMFQGIQLEMSEKLPHG